MSKVLKNVNFLLLSPFDTFGEFPAVFGNSQDESKFVILEWRGTYWWLLKHPRPSSPPLLKTLKRQICARQIQWKQIGAPMNSGSKPIFHAQICLQNTNTQIHKYRNTLVSKYTKNTNTNTQGHEFQIKTNPSRSDASAKPLLRRCISIL